MDKLTQIDSKIKNIEEFTNVIASEANKQIEIDKHKITCQAFLIGLLAVLGTAIAFYSIYSTKQLFYDMQIEEKVETKQAEKVQEITTDNGGKAIGVLGDGNEVHN